MRKALDESYGADKVSLVSAAFRWLNHHSQLSPEHDGECADRHGMHIDYFNTIDFGL